MSENAERAVSLPTDEGLPSLAVYPDKGAGPGVLVVHDATGRANMVAYCAAHTGRQAQLRLLDPQTLAPQATMTVPRAGFSAASNYAPGAPAGPIPGGLTRIDARPDGSGCDTAWTNPVSSAARMRTNRPPAAGLHDAQDPTACWTFR